MTQPDLVDPFGRTISYLRLSVTDRCDFRCTYCMAEDMTFVPRKQLLSLEELAFIAETFIELGTKRIRITGGEPLIRRDVTTLMSDISRHNGLEDLAITTNGSHLAQYAEALFSAGVTRINISLDSLDNAQFKALTRTGELDRVLAGIEAARQLPFKKIKLNTVALRGFNDHELVDLVAFASERQLDISFIEEMPLGETTAHNRKDAFLSSEEIRDTLAKYYTLGASTLETGGPSRYWRVAGSDTHIGFISPHSHNFCSSCNRVRLTAEGRLLMCLGNEHSVDLRAVIRRHPFDKEPLIDAIKYGLTIKPERHHFNLDEAPQILRFMNATGG
ncbi:MAG TPA: GTP 3',8-cyclase MoaA [Marinagarivorans sp.]